MFPLAIIVLLSASAPTPASVLVPALVLLALTLMLPIFSFVIVVVHIGLIRVEFHPHAAFYFNDNCWREHWCYPPHTFRTVKVDPAPNVEVDAYGGIVQVLPGHFFAVPMGRGPRRRTFSCSGIPFLSGIPVV